MTEPTLVLWGEPYFTSPYVFSVFVALTEKKLPFDLELVSLDIGAHRRPPFRDDSLTARVPALQHGDFWLAESAAIVEYLEESFPPPGYARLLPVDRQQRARARQVQGWLRSDLMPIRVERSAEVMFFPRQAPPLSPQGETARATLLRVAERLIDDGRTTLFDEWCIADSELAFMLHRLILTGDTLPPAVLRFATAQWQRPSVQAFVNRPRPAEFHPALG